jgi:hypothetical protein
MNRSKMKTLYVLLGVLVVVSLVTFGVSRLEQHKENIKNSEETILELSEESITTLSWECGSKSYAFHRDEDGSWLYDTDEEFPVDQQIIADMLDRFADFGVSFEIEDVDNLGDYGLDHPECTINLESEDASYEILLGDYSTMDSKRYISIGDGKVYLVNEDPLDDYDVELSDLIDQDEIPYLDEVKSIAFTGTENYAITYEANSTDSYSEDDAYFAELDGTQKPLDTSLIKNYLRTLAYLDLTDYVTYKATDEDLVDYGLDTPTLTVAMEYEPEEDADENDDGAILIQVGRVSDDEDADAYVRIDDSGIIYRISSDIYENLSAVSYDSLRHKEVLWADTDDVTRLDVTLEGETYTINCEGKGDKRTYEYEDEEVEMASFWSAVDELEADSFTTESPSEKEEIRMTVHLDDDNFPEVEIVFYRYDGENCLAVVNGETVSLVPRSAVVDLIEAVNGIVL